MNVTNMNTIADWLDAGAPHLLFDMNFAHTPRIDEGSILEQYDHLDDFDEYLEVTHQIGKDDCGSVCCIAGAAMLMAEAGPGEIFPSLSRQIEMANEHPLWEEIRNRAAEFLGLEIRPSYAMGHRLFDPVHAPENCTPQEAAEAVRRVIAGEEPWGE